jgi:hypothetical protein
MARWVPVIELQARPKYDVPISFQQDKNANEKLKDFFGILKRKLLQISFQQEVSILHSLHFVAVRRTKDRWSNASATSHSVNSVTHSG